jgi:hypothetical protein
MSITFALLLLACAHLGTAPAAKPATYPQLIATQYPTGAPLPAGVAAPQPDYSFVDRSKLPADAVITSAARAAAGAVWVVTSKGPFKIAAAGASKLEPPRQLKPHQPQTNEDSFPNCVAADNAGHVYVGTTAGLYVTDGDQWWQPIDRNDGMPYENIRCLLLASNGDIWGGTVDGAWRLRGGNFRLFRGKRWLPANNVTGIWQDANGRTWLQTEGGASCIEERAITLGAKAKYFNELTQKWNNRHGFINERDLKRPGDLNGSVFEVSDNDGLWNAIYVVAMAYRYAATKDPEAKQQAWQAMNAMLELERITGISGFPARAIMTDDEIAAGHQGFNAEETVRVAGETEKIWFRSKIDPHVWCKGDTSSDELDGHYFAWLAYSELCATPEERRKIAAACARVTDNVIAGGYNLIGHTGRKTLWGVWGPETLNDDPAWWDQRPLNSLEILSYLITAYHLTGDAKYEQHYEKLIKQHHYLLNSLPERHLYFGQWNHVNHSDDEMLYMNYSILLTLEKDPARRRLYLQSFRNTWEDNGIDHTLKLERSPLYNYLYGGLSGRPCCPDEAEETLQDWPWDRVSWACTNDNRQDVTFKEARGLRSQSELTRVLPASEIALHRWNGNPFAPNGGDDGRVFDDGAAFLLGYWAGVYYGYLPAEH